MVVRNRMIATGNISRLAPGVQEKVRALLEDSTSLDELKNSRFKTEAELEEARGWIKACKERNLEIR